jgi:hypothetical protein
MKGGKGEDMHILERYVRNLQDDPTHIVDLFAEDGYFYDGGMKMQGRPQYSFHGRDEIRTAFSTIPKVTGRICINGNAVRYDVLIKGQLWEAIGVASINVEGKLQSYVAEVLPLGTPPLHEPS